MASPFRLLNLPFIPMKKIVSRLDKRTLILMALRNPNFKKAIKHMKISVDKLTWELNKHVAFCLSIQFDGKTVKFIIPNNILHVKRRPTHKKVISASFDFLVERDLFERNSVRLKMNKNEKIKNLTGMERIELLTHTLLDILEVKEYGLKTETSKEIDFFNCFIWKITKSFYKFDFCPKEIGCKYLDEYNFFQNEVETKELLLKFPDKSGAKQFTLPLKHRNVKIVDSYFISFDSFLNMEFVTLTINRSEINCNDLNAIILKWMNGGLKNLEKLSAEISNSGKFKDRGKLLEGITIDGPTTTGLHYLCLEKLNVWNRDAKDLYRPSDGKRATILAGQKTISFYVWNIYEIDD